MNKKIVTVLILFVIMIMSLLSLVSAGTFGYTNVGATGAAPSANQVRGYYYELADNVASINYGYVFCYSATVSEVKIVLWHSNGTLFAVSNPVVVNTSAIWWQTTFPAIPTMTSGWYLIGVIANNSITLNYDANGNATSSAADNANNYATPTTLSVSANYARTYSIYIDYNEYVAPTPTPEPTPITYVLDSTDYTGTMILALFIILSLYLSIRPVGTVNLAFGVLTLGVSAGLALGGYLGGLWFFTFAGVAVGLICLLRGTDLL